MCVIKFKKLHFSHVLISIYIVSKLKVCAHRLQPKLLFSLCIKRQLMENLLPLQKHRKTSIIKKDSHFSPPLVLLLWWRARGPKKVGHASFCPKTHKPACLFADAARQVGLVAMNFPDTSPGLLWLRDGPTTCQWLSCERQQRYYSQPNSLSVKIVAGRTILKKSGLNCQIFLRRIVWHFFLLFKTVFKNSCMVFCWGFGLLQNEQIEYCYAKVWH